jgi:hypothetical protein
MTDITEDELLKAIQDALAQDQPPGNEPGTITTTEFAEHQGASEGKARAALKKLTRTGHLVPAWVLRTDDWNVSQKIKGYRLATKKPGG